MKRREFLASMIGAGATLSSTNAEASPTKSTQEFVGVLCDTTRCIGCRACEKACAEANDLKAPDMEDSAVFDKERTTGTEQFTIVNRYETDKGEVFAKKQCMHCWQPACTSACLTKAMYKTKEGPVVWRADKCMGCRFCMVACPYDIPKFEYNSWNPRIQKCHMCWEHMKEGEKPACVKACPTEALMFGMKRKLMETARTRIYHHPDDYVHHIYGEHEAGGAGWLYLSPVPFEELGFNTKLGNVPYPEYTKDFLYIVPVILFGFPSLLLGLNLLSGEPKTEAEKEDEA
jgi:formate dehydrogenase iron-sulfur subunit